MKPQLLGLWSIDIAVDGLVAGRLATAFKPHAAGDLLRRPAQLQALSDVSAQIGIPFAPLAPEAPGPSLAPRGIGPITDASSSVPDELSAEGAGTRRSSRPIVRRLAPSMRR